ncbi:hypothetical protein M427DRAFT_71874 [Gonapodya prolifera JEL478]|uniref:SH3 domain-containing protein n=1 Tax=Gonapodya prolifera (strain JEL478) TaxID=1344416 RepID=A0A139A7J8_GONPJ|nr:hypothetical protein M427DRAFT_71874 [Gonapodya prolifera JEL478]|eukprot:KXS12781.1 hypothetical protein M427DRAFT_71874 [Gonapodya prolifera JEL478]
MYSHRTHTSAETSMMSSRPPPNPFHVVAPPPGPPREPPPPVQSPDAVPPPTSAVEDPPVTPDFSPVGKRFNARLSYDPRQQDELLVAVGDIVEVHVNYGDGWGLSSNHTARKTAVMPFFVLGEPYVSAIVAADTNAGAPPAYSVAAPASEPAPPRTISSYSELLHIADATSPDPQRPGLRTLNLVFRDPSDLEIVGPLAGNSMPEQNCGYKSKRVNGSMMYFQYVPRISSVREIQKRIGKDKKPTIFRLHFLFSDDKIWKQARRLFPPKTEKMWAQTLADKFVKPICAGGQARVAVIDVGGAPEHHIVYLIRSTTAPTSYPTYRLPSKYQREQLNIPQVSSTPLYQLQQTAAPSLPPLDDQTRTRWSVQVGAVFRGVYKAMGTAVVGNPYTTVRQVVPYYGYGYGYYDPTALILLSLMWSPFYGYGFGYGWIGGWDGGYGWGGDWGGPGDFGPGDIGFSDHGGFVGGDWGGDAGGFVGSDFGGGGFGGDFGTSGDFGGGGGGFDFGGGGGDFGGGGFGGDFGGGGGDFGGGGF